MDGNLNKRFRHVAAIQPGGQKMAVHWRRMFRNVVALMIVLGLFHLSERPTLFAAGPAAAVNLNAADDGLCEETCGPSVSCEQGCWSYADQMPLFHTTCGEYSGGPWNGVGQCLGVCGDSFCNEYNEEEYGPEGCPEDCGQCGDSVCDPTNGENATTCYADCHSCGDGICDSAFSENCGTCASDCNPSHLTCGDDGEPGDSCDEGKFVNGSGYCCLPSYADPSPSICGYCTGGQQCIAGWNPFLGQDVYMCLGEGEGCGSSPRQDSEAMFSCTLSKTGA